LFTQLRAQLYPLGATDFLNFLSKTTRILNAQIIIASYFSSPLRKKKNFGVNNNEDEAKIFLERFNKELSALSTEVTIADWNYATNLTDHNAAILVCNLDVIFIV